MTPFTSRKILTSQTVGERLAKIRQGNNLSLVDVARQIGIKLVYLEAIEAGLYGELPGDIYALEFIKAYARYLRLDGAVVGREYASERQSQTSKSAAWLKPRQELSHYAPAFFKLGVAALAGLAVFFTGNAVLIFLAPPRLEVFSPVAYYEAKDSRILLSGQTAPAAHLFVNNQELPVDPSGAFSEVFHLPPGLTLLKIKAEDSQHRQRLAYRTIIVPAVTALANESMLGQVAGASTTREILLSK